MTSKDLRKLKWIRMTALVTSVLYLSSCVTGREAPLNVEVCTIRQGGMSAAIQDLQHVAQLHNLMFFDNSIETRNELRTADAGEHVKYGIDNIVMIYLQRGSNVKVVISSIGLPNGQLLFSFFYKDHNDEDGILAEQIYAYLKSKYRTEKLPVGKEAAGIDSCH